MNRVDLAIRTFFWILFNKRLAEKIEPFFEPRKELATEEPPAQLKAPAGPSAAPVKKPSTRSEAVQVIALLQREGRLIDFLKEPLTPYSDAQIGAAVRDIHRDCSAIIDRVFGVKPLMDAVEESQMNVEQGFDPARIRLTGNISGNPPYKGVLRHHGWIVTKAELPLWQGKPEDADVVAPAEVEVG